MKLGALPYWPCGGEVLTRHLDASGRLTVRPVAADEAHRLIGFYGDGPEAASLHGALAKAEDWRRAAAGVRDAGRTARRGANVDTTVLSTVVEQVLALHAAHPDRPVLVGLDGAVAAGKSTAAAQVAANLQMHGLGVAVVSADGFLLSAERLRAAGLMARKGFPESFDRPAMAAFLAAVRAGEAPDAPRYSHAEYDVSPDETQSSAGAVVIFEGVNVLGDDLSASYDLRVYLDVAEDVARTRFLKRFVATPFSPLRAGALAPWKPGDGDPAAWGEAVWAAINGPNLREHIAANRARADLTVP